MAGGKGTRLYPLTANLPKPLVPVANKPIIVHIIELLKKHGFKEIVLTVSSSGKEISEILGDGSHFNVQITYKWEDRPLGTAGGLKNFEEGLTEPFLVISGDILTDIDLSQLREFHQIHDGIATLTLTHSEDPIDYAIVTRDTNERVNRFLEKPRWNEVFSNMINVGIYILEPRILNYVEKNKPLDFSMQLYPLLLEQGEPIFGYFTENYWLDIGTPQRYLQANHDVLTRDVNLNIPATEIEDHIWVGEGTKIDPSATIHSPAIIGHNCTIQKESVIDRTSIVGDDVATGASSTIKGAIIWNNAIIGEKVKLDNCIIASRVNLGAGSVIEDGAIIGADCTIGNGSIIKSSVLISPNHRIKSNTIIDKNMK
jgi:mannose-1-phosphate guanylyltransferase/phosphomannomutase